MSKNKLKEVSLWVMAAGFPLMYVSAVTLESAPLTTISLVIMGVAAAIAAKVF